MNDKTWVAHNPEHAELKKSAEHSDLGNIWGREAPFYS